jgi:hypothetical protein
MRVAVGTEGEPLPFLTLAVHGQKNKYIVKSAG